MSSVDRGSSLSLSLVLLVLFSIFNTRFAMLLYTHRKIDMLVSMLFLIFYFS
jgi:hypothetical protein